MTTELLVRGEKIIRVETTEFDRVVDFDDIAGHAEPDDWYNEAPWEDCDGYEHEIDCVTTFDGSDMDDLRECRGYVMGERYQNSRIISIDDDVIIDKWGHTRHNGESKQVWLERVARVKRDALDQLVKWYSDGWCIWTACAEYGDYSESVGGMYDDDGCSDYVEETVLEMRMEVASQMEDDGYEVINMPDPPKPYSRVDQFRDQIRRNLDMS